MSEQRTTSPVDLDQSSDNFIVIAPLSQESNDKIASIQAKFIKRFGEENLWIPSGDQLHITFSSIIAPNVMYAEDRQSLFVRVHGLATLALNKLVAEPVTISSQFNTVEAFPSAVVLKASNNGTFNRLRSEFTKNFSLPEGTPMPPEIIHTTILRFQKSLDLLDVQKFTNQVMAELEPFEEITTSLELIHEKKIFLQSHDVLDRFPVIKS